MKKRKLKFNDGGLADYEREPSAEDAAQQKGAVEEYYTKKYGYNKDTDGEISDDKFPTKDKSFKEAFADARKAGDKTFEWKGKKYGTDVAAPKKAAKSEDKENPEMVRKAYQEAAQLRKPKETPETQYERVKNEPGIERVAPELDVLPVGKIAAAGAATAAALKGMKVLGSKYAGKVAAEKAGEETAKRAAKIAAGKEAAKKTRAEASGAMKGDVRGDELRYKKGGTVRSSASKRADGCAIRGKTRA